MIVHRGAQGSSDWDNFVAEVFAIAPEFNETLIIHLYKYKSK